MIEVQQLTKVYGTTTAIASLDFSIERGEIVGFLGPNGAGKTTTMRILAGSLGATSGVARVGGVETSSQPRAVKAMVGYLPEFPPLYTDMTVRSYLRFCAQLKRAPNPKADVERVIERVGLTEVAHRLIQHTSKGYRQRVGIAQALVHSPQVLILDEPASGLDPAQRVEIRNLVRELATGDVTVILSTHVLPEVEAICDRAIIIHEGKIIAEDRVEALTQANRVLRVRVARPDPLLLARLAALEGVAEANETENGVFVLRTTDDVREHVASAAVAHGLLELRAEAGLEDIYLQLTGGTA